MKPSQRMTRCSIGIMSVIAVAIMPFQLAEAAWFSRHRPYETQSRVIVVLPLGATQLPFSDGTYYYHGGHYYKHVPHGYVVVPAPVGVVVPTLPEPHRTIVIDGVTYHEYDGVYYKGGPAGYTVVPLTPASAASSVAVASSAQPAPGTVQRETVINVQNKNGSYTPVTLQLANSGMYIGPQGEIYPNLPTMQQLQSMYGK